MVELIMFFGGGFLVAGLLALVMISFVHHRAVRLTQRRLEDAIPVSMAEIQADKDNLRAEFAMSARRLEMSVEQLKAKATNQLGDIARKTEAINKLKAELAEKTGVTDELDAKAKSLSSKIRETEQEYAVKAAAVESTARALAAKEAELAKAATDVNEQRLASDTQKVEIAVLRGHVEQFKSQVDELQQEAQDAARRLFDERVAVSTVTKELEEKRQAVDVLRPQVAQLEREIAAFSSELESRNKRIDELDTRVGEQDRLLYQRASEIGNLQQELAASKDAHARTGERLTGEKNELERLLATANNTVASRSARIDDLEKWVSERDQLLNQRANEISGLQQQLAASNEAHTRTSERLSSASNTIDSHSARIDDLEKWVSERDQLISQREAEIRALNQQIAAAREEHTTTVERILGEKAGVEKLLSTANAGLEARASRIEELEGWVAERDGLLHQRDDEIKTLLGQIAADKEEHAGTVERILGEKAGVETLLDTANSSLETRAARIGDLEGWIAERDARIHQREEEINALLGQIAANKEEHGAAYDRVQAEKGSFEKLLQTATQTLETRAARIEDLQNWVAERDELLRRRDVEIKTLFQEIATIKDETSTAAAQQRAERAQVESQLKNEKAQLEGQLQNTVAERNQAQNQLVALNQEADATWRAERAENTLLRERIGDVAAQIAHAALAMDKSGPQVAAILAESAGMRSDGFGRGGNGEEGTDSSLTDRIRKLQGGAVRASSAS